MKLHIFQDELGLYADSTIKRVYKLNLDKDSLFINISQNKNLNSQAIVISDEWHGIVKFLKELDCIDCVYFHCYNYISQRILNEILKRYPIVRVYWIFWSGEFYNLSEFKHKHYLGKSLKFVPENSAIRKLKNRIYHLREFAYGRPYFHYSHFIKSFKKIHFFCGLLKSDFKNVSAYAGLNIEHRPFAYIAFDEFLKGLNFEVSAKKSKDCPRVMLNHSGDPILNHFDALDRLKIIDRPIELVMPLVYGNPAYIAEIKSEVQNSLERTVILEKKMETQEYMEFLSGIDVAIFNSTIQQGVGNILPLLWFGVKLFLRKENPIYIDFKAWGFCIESIQDDNFEQSLFTPLTQDQVSINRSLLQKYFSDEALDRYYLELFS